MKYSELNKKTIVDLKQQMAELSEDLFTLKLKNKTHQLEDKSQIRKVKRDLARIKTRMTELGQQNS